MSDEPHSENSKKFRHIRLLKALTFLVLSLENIVEHGWRLVGWILVFFTLWLCGVPQMGGFWLSLFLSVLFVAGCAYFLWHDTRRFRLPSSEKTRRRLEKFNNPLFLAAIIGYLGICIYAYVYHGYVLSMSYIIPAMILSMIVTNFFMFMAERQQKAFIKNAFSQYLSPSVIDVIVKDPSKLSLGG